MTSYEGQQKHRIVYNSILLNSGLKCFRWTLEIFSLVPFLTGEECTRWSSQRCRWSGRRWRVVQPQRRDAHRAIVPPGFSIQHYHQGQGSNQFNMVAGRGRLQWVQPTHTHTSNSVPHREDTVHWYSSFAAPLMFCDITLLTGSACVV